MSLPIDSDGSKLWVKAVFMQQEAKLDPQRDHEVIMSKLAGYEFPWDYQRSMVDLVFMKGLAAPRIVGLIGVQGYIQAHPQKRYDDTSIMVIEFVKHGYSSERGQAMIAQMNHVHSRFKIRQVDYLYILTGLMFEPIRWIQRFGWRPLGEAERLSHFYFWREVGLRMGLTIIPDSYEACERFNVEYEQEQFHRTALSVEVGNVLFKLLESWVPKIVRPFVKPGMATLLDPVMLQYFDIPAAPAWMSWLVPRALKLRAWAIRQIPPTRKKSGFYVDKPIRSYPDGYEIPELGPPQDWRAPSLLNIPQREPKPKLTARSAKDDVYCEHNAS